VAGSLAAFMALFGFLTYQLRIGHDPALAGKTVIQPVVAPKRVLVKRIEDHVIVTKLLPPKGDDGGSAPQQLALVTSTPSAPAQSGPVVVQSAPAPAPAPAPVAPVVTKTS
jgi:hypothetical protein